ncbi:Nif3-like dinuclear metal center hexameric protein [Brevibacterium daeguense]|uniref:GTP cyclohydrolase 1 type 2 homolog n=1 Tax=Brevibacterium daeguense TaxID=909936 RepID=A0ABP8EIW7_9MICO|nr:Nif3-like dinuclear metal center hexameric protein [Brevibacterium daeguense]
MSNATTVESVIALCEELWPAAYAEGWDTVGLAVGDPGAEAERILMALDPTDAVVEEAVAGEYDLLFTHHPLLLRGVTSVHSGTLKGGAVSALIRAGIAQFNAHTNADSVVGGVSDVLIEALGVRASVPLVQSATAPEGVGLGRVGNLPAPAAVEQLARRLAEVLDPTATGVRIAGDPAATVTRVAALGGAGDSLFDEVRASGAEVYVTSDLRHHPASEARDTAHRTGGTPHLIDISHWAAEALWLDRAADQLSSAAETAGLDLDITVSRIPTDPWVMRIDQQPQED